MYAWSFHLFIAFWNILNESQVRKNSTFFSVADSLIASETGSPKGSQRDEFLDFALLGEEKPNSIDSEQSSIATDLIAYIFNI